MATFKAPSTPRVTSTTTPLSTPSSRPLKVTNLWRDTAQGLVGGPGGSATEHPTCGQLSGQARGAETTASLAASPGGLVDLATVLSKRAEDREALFAATAALARVGITEALDLSFLGSGDVLPEETVAEVLENCTVPGTAEALEHMFRIAREGMEGTMSLMLTRLGPTQRAPSRPEVTGQAWEGLSGSKAERRVRSAVDPAPPQKRVRYTKEEHSLNVKLTEEMQKAIDSCFRVLDELGYASPRYKRVKNPVKGQEASVIKLQTNAFIHNFSSPKGLNAARRRFETYLLAMRGLGVNPLAPEEWTLAAFITEQAQRGASSPRRMVQALTWAERAFELSLGLESPLVQAQRSSWNPGEEAPVRKPAKTPSLEMVRDMENLLFEAESNMMRCWAGAQCAMAHGCLRWADLQATKDLKLTKDAVFGVSWRMKGKKTHVPWAALRIGFTGRDWGSAWLSELAAANLPGEDFILKAPDSSWTSFANRIADFSDGQAAMRALLVKAGMTVQSAMTFSCHSWRHFYPTAGAQLDVHQEAVDTMGHWSPGTGMGALYDGKACVSELLNKEKVLKAVSAGWNLSEPGCLPAKPGAMHPENTQRQSRASSSSPRACARQASSSRPSSSSNTAKEDVMPKMMVLNTRRLRIHGYREGIYPLCRHWKCGTPDNPTLDAMFVDKLDESSSHMTVCRSCEWQQQKCVFPTTSSTPPKDDEECSSSSSSSSSS